MTSLIFDIETNGFLDVLDRVHCLVIEDADTKEHTHYADQPGFNPIEEGVRRLMEADVLIGHNIIKFDLAALRKVYPWFKHKARLLDTMVLARMFWPELKVADKATRQSNASFPGKLVGSYKLEAFGYRLGIMKGEFKGPWEVWTPEMQNYCGQDVRVNAALWRKALIRWLGGDKPPPGFVPYSDESIDLEMRVQAIVGRQEAYGFCFDEQRAAALYAELADERHALEQLLKAVFKPWFIRDGKKDFVPKKDNKKMGYMAGCPVTKVKLVEFKPSSRHHIASRLTKLYGWKPVEFTDAGLPKVDDEVMAKLSYPEAPLLMRYLMIEKRIGQLAEGDNALLKLFRNGAIHGGVITLGAVTRRMTHVYPNVAQTPSVKKPYGKEFRSLYRARVNKLLVGCDADSLELRLLGGYMAPYDGGAYIEVILAGNRDLGTDMHSVNARALGMDPKKDYLVDGTPMPGREIAKTWFYAFIYGGGAEKLGWILGKRGDPNNEAHWTIDKRSGERVDVVARSAGSKSKKDFLKNLPALGKLAELVQKKAKMRGFLVAIDGGKLHVRKLHSAVNTLLQSAGAIFMKKALVILDDQLQALDLVPGIDYEFVANIHDEWQIEVEPKHVELIEREAEGAIKKAGEHWKFKCPLVGNASHGLTWADTH